MMEEVYDPKTSLRSNKLDNGQRPSNNYLNSYEYCIALITSQKHIFPNRIAECS